MNASHSSQRPPVLSSASPHMPANAGGSQVVTQPRAHSSSLNKRPSQYERHTVHGSSTAPSAATLSRAPVAQPRVAHHHASAAVDKSNCAESARAHPAHSTPQKLSAATVTKNVPPQPANLTPQLPQLNMHIQHHTAPRPQPAFASQQYVILPHHQPHMAVSSPIHPRQQQQPGMHSLKPAYESSSPHALSATDRNPVNLAMHNHSERMNLQTQRTYPSPNMSLSHQEHANSSSMHNPPPPPTAILSPHPQLEASPQLENAAVCLGSTASLPPVVIPQNQSQASSSTQGQQQSKPFACSRPAPRPRDPTLMRYYERLNKTIQEATEFSCNLRYPAESASPDQTQIARVIAHDLQGVPGSEVDELLKERASNKDYIQTFNSKLAGDFVEYGVSGTQLSSIVDDLCGAMNSSNSVQPPISPQETHANFAVERARVRVFEAEITYLPLAFGEKLVKIRRSMRRFKSRIELHVRIILALEGKGRKVSDAQLDRLKLQLEKADQQAENDRKRRMAAEAAKNEKERRSKDAAKQNEKTGLKEKELKKRKRQEQAQASFMKRFVKPKTEEREGEAREEEQFVRRGRTGHYAQEIADDPDVMTVGWWLRSEIEFVSESELDELLLQGASDLKSHLRACAARRVAAEKALSNVLQNYRARRRVPCDDRYPHFVRKRAEVRGRGKLGPIKLLQFDENFRPAYYGTYRKSKTVCGRRPFKKDSELNYDHDSEAEWEEEEGEDIQDVEDDKELASEEAELKKLYGSDDEDDDDFLDDDEAGDDDDDEDDNDDDRDESDGPNEDGEKSNKEGQVVDLTKNTQKDSRKTRDVAKVKRKKPSMGSVVIDGVSFTGASKLDAFPVSTFPNSKPIQMFNPYVFSASDIVAEHLKAKIPSTRPNRPSSIDEKAKLDLAVALVNDGSNRDRIVFQFCESRRTRGLNVPAKSEVVRAISEMATREKRDGDTRAVWHLNDVKLERMVQQMEGVGQLNSVTRPITTPLPAMK